MLVSYGAVIKPGIFQRNGSVQRSSHDIKAPLTDLDGDSNITVADMIAFMHADNLAGGEVNLHLVYLTLFL